MVNIPIYRKCILLLIIWAITQLIERMKTNITRIADEAHALEEEEHLIKTNKCAIMFSLPPNNYYCRTILEKKFCDEIMVDFLYFSNVILVEEFIT